ncbi:MAG: MFS transporter [Chloroflexota bacterium]
MNHRSATIVTGAAYAVFGLLYGVWAVLLTDLARELGLSEGPLGLALTAGFVGSLPVMVAGGHLADRFGSRTVAIVAGSLLAVSFASVGIAGSFLALVIILFVFFAASGAYDVGINAAAMELERASGRRVLAAFHAAFSGGGMVGALAAGLLLATGGFPFRIAYLAVGVALLLVVLAWLRVAAPTAPGEPAIDGAPPRASPYRDRLLLLLATLTALAFFAEGAMETWSGIYLRGSLDLPPLTGAAGVAIFHAAMLVGRTLTATVGGRIGSIAALRGAGLLAAAAMAVALATEVPLLVIGGFLLVGLGLSAIAPLAFSLAGRARPDDAGRASSVITTLGYAGFLFGPGLIGTVAETATLRIGLLAVVLAGLVVAVLAGPVGRAIGGRAG